MILLFDIHFTLAKLVVTTDSHMCRIRRAQFDMCAVKPLHPEIVVWCTRLCEDSSIQYVLASQLGSLCIGRSSIEFPDEQ